MTRLLPSALLSTLLLSACASMTPNGPSASATITPASGSTVTGSTSFVQTASGLRITAQISGLTPGEHGFHVHEVGDCSAPDASSAKGHYNPDNHSHGHVSSTHHAGDMPNLIADAEGKASYSADLPGLSIKDKNGVNGRAVVIHADPDDYKSQPAGNSGKRIACGVIKAN